MMLEQYRDHLLLVGTLMVVASTGFASKPIESNKQTMPPLKYSGVATVSVGPVWENTGDTQTFYLAPNIEKTYAANRTSHARAYGEIFLGIQKPLLERLQGQIGLAAAMVGDASLSGNIWDDADPQFNNYTYGYKVRHTHVALKGKLLANISTVVMPWVSASIGVGFNQAHDFNNTPIISEAIVMPNFTNNTTTTTTYTLGIGVAKNLNQHWQVGLGYEFSDWGKSNLGRASEQTLNTGLSLSHVYTNGLLFNLTYLA